MSGTYEDLKKATRFRESTNDYQSNKNQYKGAYQLGISSRVDIGAIDENGNWTGKYGNSEEEFLNSKEIQDRAADAWFKKNWDYIKSEAKEKIGKKN